MIIIMQNGAFFAIWKCCYLKKRTNITNTDATKNNTIRNYYTNVLLLKNIYSSKWPPFLFNEKEINFQQALSAFIPFQKCKNIIVKNITNFQIVKSKNKDHKS